MNRLSRIEEKRIIERAIKMNKFLGSGSSRAVYSLGNGYCLKVAIDKQGQFQNHTEIRMFKKHGDEFLAEVQSYGKYVVVMEEITVDEEAFDDALYSARRNYSSDEAIESDYDGEEIQRTMYWLEDELGYTSDNEQIGFRESTGQYVAFDYGLDTEFFYKSVSDTLRSVMHRLDDKIDLLHQVALKL